MQSPLLNVMTAAAIKAGKGLLRDFGEVDQLQISRKGTSNFVTKTDIRTEKLLVSELKKARPDFGFLLEEGGEVKGKDATHRWIIDPLDGTSNFIHAIPYFCISIGLERTDSSGKSEIIAGVIYDPIHNDMFTAEKGKGALVNNRKLQVSNRDVLDTAMLVTSKPRSDAAAIGSMLAMSKTLADEGGAIRHLGATALDLAYLAAGKIDACWYYTLQPWDVAAGLLLVQEAGGLITDMAGKPLTPYSQTLVATNRALSTVVGKLLSAKA